jgi:D-alanyl-D-alanine carboxypeptidase
MRKRVIVAALALLVAAMSCPLPAAAASLGASQPPAVAARAGTLYDPIRQAFLWSERPDLELPVASLTKLMTAYLALHEPAAAPVRVGDDAAAMPQTKAGLVPGRTYTLGSLLPLLIVRSANDVAVAIADALGGSVPAFAADMNREAAALRLGDTHYANPSGLDAAGQHSSAHDVAVLAGLDMDMPAFAALARLTSATLPGGATFADENPFLGAYPGSDGVKTGFTSTAGFCLAASATRGGRRLIAVVLDEPSWAQAVADASALLSWGFAQPVPAAATDPVAASMIPLALPGAAQAAPAAATGATPSEPAGDAPSAATAATTTAVAGATAGAVAATTTSQAGATADAVAAATAAEPRAAIATAEPATAAAAAGSRRPAAEVAPHAAARRSPAPAVAARPAVWLTVVLAAIALLGLGAVVARQRGSRPGA